MRLPNADFIAADREAASQMKERLETLYEFGRAFERGLSAAAKATDDLDTAAEVAVKRGARITAPDAVSDAGVAALAGIVDSLAGLSDLGLDAQFDALSSAMTATQKIAETGTGADYFDALLQMDAIREKMAELDLKRLEENAKAAAVARASLEEASAALLALGQKSADIFASMISGGVSFFTDVAALFGPGGGIAASFISAFAELGEKGASAVGDDISSAFHDITAGILELPSLFAEGLPDIMGDDQ